MMNSANYVKIYRKIISLVVWFDATNSSEKKGYATSFLFSVTHGRLYGAYLATGLFMPSLFLTNNSDLTNAPEESWCSGCVSFFF